MSEAKKCDSCGELYENNCHYQDNIIDPNNELNLVLTINIEMVENQTPLPWDNCPTCFAKLLRNYCDNLVGFEFPNQEAKNEL